MVENKDTQIGTLIVTFKNIQLKCANFPSLMNILSKFSHFFLLLVRKVRLETLSSKAP